MPQITIYTTSWCAYCRAEKQWLDGQGITYEALDVEQDRAAAAAMMAASHQLGVPVTVITRDDQSRAVIVGFDQAALAKELHLAS